MIIFHLAALYAMAFGVAGATAKSCAVRWQGDEKKIKRCVRLIILGCLTVVLLASGLTMRTVQTIILAALLCYLSYSDIKTMEVDDHLHIMVLLTAMMTMTGGKLLDRAAVAAAVFGLWLLVAMIPKNDLGGADIKFIAACAFLMPVKFYLMGMILGLLLAVGFNLQNQRKEEKRLYPLLPYLSVGMMAAFLLVDIL